jgi:hypothetical protein
MPETKEDTKTEDQPTAKERAAAEKKAAEQDAADIETFWSFHRGDLLVRDSRGCLDMNVARAEYEAAKEDGTTPQPQRS